MQIALLVAYPILVQLSFIFNNPSLQTAAIMSLTCGLLYKPLKKRETKTWLTTIFIALLSALALHTESTIYALYAPPIIVPSLLCIVFGYSLTREQTPIVTAIGEASRGPLSPEMICYTRGVTQLWTIVFMITIANAILLPILTIPTIWSWTVNVVNYIVVGIIFLGEFIYRKHRFKDHNHPNFVEYIRIVTTTDIRKL